MCHTSWILEMKGNRTMPFVSVIIPVYKSEKVLETAVNSVLSQSFADFEILLVDDGSPDNSYALCKRLQEKDSRIYVYHKDNGGICSARNFGLLRAKGKYVAFLDHDDEYMSGYLEDNIALLEKYQADFIKFERLREQYRPNGKIERIAGDRIRNLPGIENGVACYRDRDIAEHYPNIRDAVKTMYIWDGIYNREFLLSHGIQFDESFKFGHEDIMLNLEVLSYAKVIVYNEKVYYKHKYRDMTSTSAIFNEARIDDAIKTAKRESALLKQWGYPEEQILLGYMNEAYRVLNILSLADSNCSSKTKKRLTAKFWNETAAMLPDVNDSIKKLMRIRLSRGIYARLFYFKFYGFCIWLSYTYGRGYYIWTVLKKHVTKI